MSSQPARTSPPSPALEEQAAVSGDRSPDVRALSPVDSGDGADATSPPKERKKGRRAYLILGGLALVALLVVGGHAWLTRNEESTDDAQVDGGVVSVAPRIAGTISEVRVSDNTHVHAGDVIALLDTADLEARLAQARAELASREAQLHSARASEQVTAATATGGLTSARASVSGARDAVNSANGRVDQARAELVRAEADAERAALDFDRMARLAESGAVSRAEVDDARLANQAAQAALARARSNLSTAEADRRSVATQVAAAQGRLAQSEPVDAQVAAAAAATELAEAGVHQAEAAVRLAELAVSYARVVAPIDGTVSNLDAEPGRIVASGQPLATLVPDATYVVANFKETQIGDMEPGDRVDVEIDAYPGQHFDAVVDSIAAGTGASFSVLPSNNATGNFVKVVQRVPVRVAWTHPPDVPLRVGLSATVTVHTDEEVARRDPG